MKMRQSVLGPSSLCFHLPVELLLVPPAILKKPQIKATFQPRKQPLRRLPVPSATNSQNLIEDNRITKFNGARLDLEYDGGLASVDLPWSIDRAKTIPHPKRSLLG